MDFWDDQDDVYSIRLLARQRILVTLTGTDADADLNLALWLPGTRSIDLVMNRRGRVKISAHNGAREFLTYRARAPGRYSIQVRLSTPGTTSYRLLVVKRPRPQRR